LSWFDIVKVLSSKTGYAQLDFDNTVEEDEDNCKKRFQELCNKLEKATKEIERKLSDKDVRNVSPKPSNITLVFDNEDEVSSYIESGFLYNPDIPEEVYCKVLDMFDRNITDLERIGDYVLHSMAAMYEKGDYFVNRRGVYISENYEDRAYLGYSIDMVRESHELLRNLIVQDLDEALK